VATSHMSNDRKISIMKRWLVDHISMVTARRDDRGTDEDGDCYLVHCKAHTGGQDKSSEAIANK
jgi:hypothetical protein